MYKSNKRIPTILALLILFLGIGTTVYIDKSQQSNITSAKDVPIPVDVRFSNITDNSFNISWFTSLLTIGSVQITSDSQNMVYMDDLDNDNIARPRTSHYVTIKNLTENSAYSVKIIQNSGNCKNDERICPVFSQKTGNKLPHVLSLPPSHGTIVSQSNQPVTGAIIYLTVGKSSTLSGRSDSSGLWVIPLNNLRTSDLLGRIEVSDNDLVQIYAKADPGLFSSAVIDLKSIKNNTTVPPLQIGNTHNFINLMSKNSMIAKSDDQKILGTQTVNGKYNINFPENNDDTTIDNQPGFRGTGIKNSTILITVNSSPQTGRVTVGNDGAWTWRPPAPLPPGKHTINIQAYDNNEKLITITRNFIVLKSGESVLGDATASATLTPTTRPTPSSYPTVTISNTPVPSATPTNIIASPTVKQPPATGNFQTTLLIVGGGSLLMLSGIALIFLL